MDASDNPITALMAALAGQQSPSAPAPQAAPPAGLLGWSAPASPPASSGGLMGTAPPAPANLWEGNGPPQPDTTMAYAPPVSPLAITPPDSTGQPTGILGKIGKLIDGGASRVGNVLMPGPSAGMQQFISPEQVQHARATALVQAGLSMMKASQASDPWHPGSTTIGTLAAGGQTAQLAYQDALQRPSQLAQEAYAIREQQRKMAVRQAITQQYAPQPNETIPATAQRLAAMASAFGAAGMPDEAKAISEGGGGLSRGLNAPNGHPVEHIDAGDRIVAVDAVTGQELASYPKGLDPNAKTAGQRTPEQIAQAEAELRKEVTGEAKPYLLQSQAFQRYQALRADPNASPAALNTELQTVLSGSPSARAAMVQMLARGTGSTPDKIESLFTRTTGGGLSPSMLQVMDRSAANTMQANRDSFRSVKSYYSGLAKKQGLNPDNVGWEPPVVLPGDTAPAGRAAPRAAVDLSRNPFPAQ